MDIEKVAVIGAGVMGSGIAAHVANAGLPVTLLDIVPNGAKKRNVITETAVKNMLKPVKLGSPTPLMHRDNAKFITIGNIEDNLDLISDADLIIEVVLEKIKIKHDVFKKIDKIRKKDSIITSNTSTIPRKQLVEGMPKSFAKDFLITHFFNPPRYLRLLEIVAGEEVSKKKITAISELCDKRLGKEIVICNDTPGFLGNRIGVFAMQVAMTEAFKLKLSIEEADAIFAQLQNGGVFAELAKQKSKGPSGVKGGDLGYFTKDKMVPEFANAAFNLEVGKISAPVKTGFGWHIIKMVERRKGEGGNFIKKIPELRQAIAQTVVANLLAELSKNAKINLYNMDGKPVEAKH